MMLQTAAFCLWSGVVLGTFYAVCTLLRAVLGAGRVLTAVIDVLFCTVTAAVVFLCALSVSGGRLRFLQGSLQLLGGWAAAAVLCPLADRTSALLRSVFCRIFSLNRATRERIFGKSKKTGTERKNHAKKT